MCWPRTYVWAGVGRRNVLASYLCVGLVDSSWLGSGRYVGVWDGRDAHGALLPPGLYVVSLRVETDQGTTQRQAVAALVY